MTRSAKFWIFTTLAIAMAGATSLHAADFVETDKDHFCPEDTRLVSLSYANQHRNTICNKLEDWAELRIAGGGSLSGAANNCVILSRDSRKLLGSLCVKSQDYSTIRGVLLAGKFRSQSELNKMSGEDWRAALIIELANRTRESNDYLKTLSNEELAGAGELLLYHGLAGRFTPADIAKMYVEDMRQAVIIDLIVQTGMSAERLKSMSDLELIDLFRKG